MLVGVTGYAQHGKDSVAKRLVKRWGFERRGFADALKEMALVVDPLIDYGGESPEDYTVERLSKVVARDGWEVAKSNGEVRRFLQKLGTEGVRDIIGEDSWIRALEHWWVQSRREHVVISDVRFVNEARWVHRNSGIIIKVFRPNFDNGVGEGHASEREIAGIYAPYNILNDGDMIDLWIKTDACMTDILEDVRGGA